MEIVYSKLEGLLLPFLYLIKVLKHLLRTRWLRTIKNPENIATYIYRLLLLAIFALVRSIFLLTLYSLIYNKIVWISTDIYF